MTSREDEVRELTSLLLQTRDHHLTGTRTRTESVTETTGKKTLGKTLSKFPLVKYINTGGCKYCRHCISGDNLFMFRFNT